MTPRPPSSPLDARPLIVALAGPNGSGKSTFHAAHLAQAGLRFVNPDALAHELQLSDEDAAGLANELRVTLTAGRESFVFETVLSDPVGDKVGFLERAAAAGFNVVLIFIGIDSAETSETRVAMRVMQGGHDVPAAKLEARYARTLENLQRAIRTLPFIRVYDNSNLEQPFRLVAEFEAGRLVAEHGPRPRWLEVPA